jgi:alkanesulfonate monooxygenase SsuD/methylene tetrahydromethanopterin reductase-like flavin-dependent oxidoreductase (luciferase family)
VDGAAPYAPGAVSLRLYPHELEAAALIEDLRGVARAAEEAGFAGVSMGEHHAGFAGYVPNAMQLMQTVLAATTTLWASPCPVLLPLRPAATVVEDLAWLAASFPGRVACGFGSGSLDVDFDLVDVPKDQAAARFHAAVPYVVGALRGRANGPIGEDPAVQRCAEHPLTVLLAAMSPTAVRRAAEVGAGIMLDPISPPDRARELSARYVDAGGAGPRVLIQQVWLGELPEGLHGNLRSVYESYSEDRNTKHWRGPDNTVAAGTAEELAVRLSAIVEHVGATALELRLTVPGLAPDQTRAQLADVGAEVLPRLRASWPGI